jgi:hypothetical protein
MPKKASAPKDKDRVILSQCVGKVTAYVRVGNKDEAKRWARALVAHLKHMDLLDA